jgi:pyrroline-5-carboxylate reductase
MDKRNIGFIGAGNMACALIKGLITAGLYKPSTIKASDRSDEALEVVKREYGIETFTDNRSLVKKCDILVMAVKPQNIMEALEDIKEAGMDSHLIISIAAGIPISTFQRSLGEKTAVIRVMPNTPALIQRGISALCGSDQVTPEQMEQAKEIFTAVGESLIVPEEMMDAITALSASGPGFIFRIMEDFVRGGEQLGFDPETALRLVRQTFLGSAHLACESEKTLAQLREMVTSPGGTTAAGLSVFDKQNSEAMIEMVLRAAHERSIELGKGKR